MRKLWWGLVTFVCSSLASADPLPPERVVNRVSITMTGKIAGVAQVETFKRDIAARGYSEAYRRLVRGYFNDPGYAKSMEQLHSTFWRIDEPAPSKHAAFVVTQDRPYDEIYSRDYIYADLSAGTVYQSLDAKVVGDFPLNPGVWQRVPLEAGEPRFRGFFSSPEFLRVYPDTPSNVNRKRSNQVFRIAFCQTLTNTPFAGSFNHPTLAGLAPDDHGTNPECIGCHRRLDPMARFMDHWLPPTVDGLYAEYDPDRPSLGTVHLGGPIGMDRSYRGAGDGELGKIIIKQPEYQSCVADLAWSWAFGRAVPLDDSTRADLVSVFAKTRRFNAVALSVLEHPYFWSDLEAPAINYASVRPLLAVCAGCHAESDKTQFDPAVYPFVADGAANFRLLKSVWGAINHDTRYKPMPLPPRPKLAAETLDTIRGWIVRGARDDHGSSTLTDDQIEEILQ